MAKFAKRIVLMLWVLTLCVGMLGMTASAANDPVSAIIEVNTALSGNLPDTPETFTVEMTADKAGAPMPQDTVRGVYTMNLQGAASGKIQISFDRVGVYSYSVKQLSSVNKDCYSDSGIYHITVYVTNSDKGDGLYLSTVLNREGVAEKQQKIVFSNRYAAKAQVDLAADVTLDKKPPKDDTFSFVVKNEKGDVLQTVTNTGGMVDYIPMTFDSVGTYTFTLTEVVGQDPKIIYDRTKYTAVVTVEKDENGDYQATVVYKLSDKVLEDGITFVNRTKSGTPQTGDSANLGFWILMMVLSGCALAGIWYYDKRKQGSPEHIA